MCRQGSPALLAILTENPANAADVTGMMRNGRTALHIAAERGDTAVLQWLVSAGGDTRHAVLGCSAPTVPGHAYREANPGTVAASKAALLARLRALNTTLADCTYLVGERLSLADLALAIVLVPAFNKVCFKYYIKYIRFRF